MEMEDMSLEVAEKDTAAEIAAEAAAADPANRPPKRSSNTCQPCRLRKVRCQPGDGPSASCACCDRLGFTCSFQDASPGGTADQDGQQALTLPRRRVRLACINCHSRKARCSGETPKCKRCTQQGIECVYRPTKRSGGVNGGSGHLGDSEHESVSSEPPEKRRMLGDDGFAHHPRTDGNGDYYIGQPAGLTLGPVMSHESLIPLPEDALIVRTFDKFFKQVHHVPVFSFLHRASLMQRYHAGMMDKALLFAVFGITSLLTDLGPGTREYGAKCIDECQRLVFGDIENPSTIKIQALLLVMKYRMLTRRFTGSFMIAATASRFAYALRLNYENPNLCFLARESRRRLMWAFLTIDSGINGGYPDFTLLPSEAMHIQLPCNERNFEFDLPQVTEHLRPIPDKPFPDDVGSLALHVRLLWIRSRILYCTKNVLGMQESELGQLPKLVEVLALELKGFNNHLPASFRFSDSNLRLRAYSPRLCVFIMIHIWWRQCHCDLYRVVLSGLKEALPRSSVNRLSPQFVAFCERQCYEHAIAMAEMFRLILSLDGGLPVTDLDLPVCAYQCARMLYFAYQMNGAEFNLSADQVNEHAQRCLQITRHMTHVPAGAAVHADLEKLVYRGLSANTTPSRSGSPMVSRTSVLPHQVLSRHNPVHQMGLVDDNEITGIVVPSPSMPAPSPLTQGNLSAHHNTPASSTPHHHPTPSFGHTRPVPSFAEFNNSGGLGGGGGNNSGGLNGGVGGGGVGVGVGVGPVQGDVTVEAGANVPKPNLPPVDPPEGLDNNNAFEGAMDGFDFNFEFFGNTGMESSSWFSNEWLNAEFPQTTV